MPKTHGAGTCDKSDTCNETTVYVCVIEKRNLSYVLVDDVKIAHTDRSDDIFYRKYSAKTNDPY